MGVMYDGVGKEGLEEVLKGMGCEEENGVVVGKKKMVG